MLITAKPADVDELFIKKVKQCYQICDFSKHTTDAFIIAKDDVLREILSVLKENYPKISNDEKIYNCIFSLIAIHILRTPSPIPPEWYSTYDYYMLTDQIVPREWVHFSLVYEIAIQFFSLPQFDPNACLPLCGDIIKLAIYKCRTTNDKEQKKLSKLFLVLFEKVPKLQQFAINVAIFSLTRIIYENEPFTSAKPILYALTGIIAGFPKPLKPRHLKIFHEVILPLHKNNYLRYFARELFSCVTQFLEHDHQLVIDVLKVILHNWPVMHPEKQIIFIDEIALLSSFVDETFLKECIRLICPQLMRSLNGCHAAISEKVLSMWEVNDFVWLMTIEPSVSYPLIIPTLYEVGMTYWNPEIRLIVSAVLNVLHKNNKEIFMATGENLKKLKSVSLMNGLTRAAKWKYLIITFEENPKQKRWELHLLSMLFEGLESIDPYSRKLNQS